MRPIATPGLLLWALLALGPAASAFPEVEGWKPVGEIEAYGRDDLWEYIDGAADLFLAYGFRQLEARDIEAGDLRATVQIYDMGSRLSAFGVLATEGGGDAIRTGIGAGWVSFPPAQCLLAKDRFYVKIATTRGDLTETSAEALARALSHALPGADGLPEELARLPEGASAAGSARYTMKGYLGLSEMPPCVHAPLAGGPKGSEVFVLLPREGETDEAIWGGLAARWSPVERKGAPALIRQVPYRGAVGVIRSGTRILGLAGFEDREDLVKRLRSLAGTDENKDPASGAAGAKEGR